MTDNNDGTVTLTNEELEMLLQKTEELDQDIKLLRSSVMKVLSVLGMTTDDGKDIKPELKDKSKNPLKIILKGASKIMGLFVQAKFSAEAEKEIGEKFSFLDTAIPVIEKYGEQ